MAQVLGDPGSVVGGKEDFSLEIATPLPDKSREPFLRTWNRMGHAIDLEDAKQSALAIASSEKEAPTLGRRAPS